MRLSDGERVWSRRAQGQIKASAVTLPSWHSGALLSACGGGSVALLDPLSGRELWTGQCDGGVFATPLVDPLRRRLYVADLRGCVHAWGYAVGEKMLLSVEFFWKFHTTRRPAPHAGSEPIFSSPTLVQSGAVIFGCMDGHVYAVAPSGDLLWSFDAHGPVFSAACVARVCTDQRPHAIFTSQAGRIFCVDATDGQLRWSQPGEFHGHASAAVDTCCGQDVEDGECHSASLVCAASSDGILHAFRAGDGMPLGRQRLPSAIFSSPAIVASRVVVGCRDNNMWCFLLQNQRKTGDMSSNELNVR